MDYFTLEYLSTVTGSIAAVMLIVQVTKGIITKCLPDAYVRLYALLWAFLIQGGVAYINYELSFEVAVSAFLNGLVVMAAATGIYTLATDPKAEK